MKMHTILSGSTLVHLFVVLLCVKLSFADEVEQYCHDEMGVLMCGEGQTILVEDAAYGTIEMGRCLDRIDGDPCFKYIGDYIKGECTGLSSCHILVNDIHEYVAANLDTLYGQNECDMGSPDNQFFKVDYRCVYDTMVGASGTALSYSVIVCLGAMLMALGAVYSDIL